MLTTIKWLTYRISCDRGLFYRMFTSYDMRQAATGTMSFRVISLFHCAVEVIVGGDLLMHVEHHPSDLFRRHFIRDAAGKVGVVPEGEK